MAELKGNKYGTHRVIEPKCVLTQAAWKVDNDMTKVYSNEIVCDVTSLNIDSASLDCVRRRPGCLDHGRCGHRHGRQCPRWF